jgi:hypothetical protein
MAIVFPPGADPTHCPTCGGPMTRAQRGRHTRRWFRHCRDLEYCGTATVSDETPIDVLAEDARRHELRSRGAQRFAFAAPDDEFARFATRMSPLADVTDAARAIFDAKLAAAGTDRTA